MTEVTQEQPTSEEQSLTQTQTEDKQNPNDWKTIYGKDTALKPFVDSSESYDEFVKKAAEGYSNLSAKLGQPKEEPEASTQVDLPKEIGEYELPEDAAWFGEIALEQGLTKEQVKGIEAKFNEHINAVVETQNKEFENTLKKEWSEDYEGNFNKAKAFLKDHLSDDDVKRLNGLDNNSLLVLSKVALSLHNNYYDNNNVPSGDGIGNTSLDSLKARLDAIFNDPDYRQQTMANYKKHNELIQEALSVQTKINQMKGNL